MVARLLAHIDEFRIRTGMCKQLFTGQKVIDDDVRPLEGMQPLESNKAGIAGPPLRSDIRTFRLRRTENSAAILAGKVCRGKKSFQAFLCGNGTFFAFHLLP